MKRVLRVFWYFFTHSWGVALFASLGSALLSLGLILGVAAGSWGLAGFGAGVLLFPALWSPPVFRQLISNRRTSLLPNGRAAIVAAGSLVAVGGAMPVALITSAMTDSPSLPATMAAFAWDFVLCTTIFIAVQWTCTLRAGMLLQLLLLALILRLGFSSETRQLFDFVPAWTAALAAALAWIWLLGFLRAKPVLTGPTEAQRIESIGGSKGTTGMFGLDWLPTFQLGRASRPDGTLMRGAMDNWLHRAAAALVCIFGFAALFITWNIVIGNAASGREPGPHDSTEAVEMLMMVSFLILVIGAIGLRRLARHDLLRTDWCALRPLRHSREPA